MYGSVETLDDLINLLQQCKDNCMTGKEKVIFICEEEKFNTKNDFIYIEKSSNAVHILINRF